MLTSLKLHPGNASHSLGSGAKDAGQRLPPERPHSWGVNVSDQAVCSSWRMFGLLTLPW